MKLTKRDQPNAIQPRNFRQLMDRFFDEPFSDPFFGLMPSISQLSGSMFLPTIDMYEDDKNLTLEVTVPGFDSKNIEVQIDESLITLRGKVEEEKEDKHKKYYSKERTYGEFYREIILPSIVDTSKATSKIKNGILTVTIPKKASTERKNLSIESE